MKEFGSDFHFITDYQSKCTRLTDVYNDALLLADGRQCIIALIRQEKWGRLWVPEYYCHEVLETIRKQTSIEIVFYPDCPQLNDKEIVKKLPYSKGDALLRMNYYGMRNHRSEADIPVPVIEDHTHDLYGRWALNSDADWCIASLRKVLPIPEGGMIWSPKGHRLTMKLENSEDNQRIAVVRWEAMKIKSDYLNGALPDKEAFRKRYVETEKWFDTAKLSMIDKMSMEYINGFNFDSWHGAKRCNWQLLCSLLSDKLQILQPEDESCTMFSLVVLSRSQDQRDTLRHSLIEKDVYPAILWDMPKWASEKARDFSDRMLSIHCDGRYTDDDIKKLAGIVYQAIDS